MNEAYFITSCMISIGILFALWFGPLASMRRDNFRSDIRRLRDSLFDFMYDNGFDFNTRAYRDTRQMLNGMLRAADQLTPIRVIMAMILYCWYDRESKQQFTSYEGCSPALKQRLEETAALAVCRMIIFVFAEGVFGLAVKCLFVALRQYKRIEAAARQLSVDLYILGAPAAQLTNSQRILLRS